MNPTLTALNGLIVLLSWQSQTNTTYTVQVSDDCYSWSTLPAVFAGNLGDMEVALDKTLNPFFARLRSSSIGDTNENGLPDQWEMSQFGFLDVDPLADPDRDNMSNFSEWLAGTDPLDFYNGDLPGIHLSCGHEWIVPSGAMSGQAFGMTLTDAGGKPWPQAPVTLHLQSDSPGILQSGDDPEEAVQEVIAYTDNLGRITPESHAIHVLGAADGSHRDQLLISAGNATAIVDIRTIEGSLAQPPRDLRYEVLADGALNISWSGEPGEAELFLLEKLTAEGDWVPMQALTVDNLPQPDPASERFQLIAGTN